VPARRQPQAKADPVSRRAKFRRHGDPVAVDGAVDLDHRPAGQDTRPGGGGRRWRRAGRASAAHPQRDPVLAVQAGRHGLDQLPADEHMDAGLVSPYVRELPARAAPILILCTAGITPSTPLAEMIVSNSTAPADCAPIRNGTGPSCPVAASAAAGGAGTTAARSGWEPGRNELAGTGSTSGCPGRPGSAAGWTSPSLRVP
jgi:hypothetical protein